MAAILVFEDVGGCTDELANALAPVLDDAGTTTKPSIWTPLAMPDASTPA